MPADNPFRGRPAWLISDGKAGHEVQSRGVAEALGAAIEIKRVEPSGLWRLLAPLAPVAPGERFGQPGTPFAPPFPPLAIAIGRTTTPYLRALKRRAGDATFALVLLDPKGPLGFADLVWVPAHDRRRGPETIETLVPPHLFSPARIGQLRRGPLTGAMVALPGPRVAVLIGGPNGDYRFPPGAIGSLLAALASLAASGTSLMITASRRTPADLVAGLRTLTSHSNVWLWDGSGENPYSAMLAHADAFIVTADSVNMSAEPAATGCPIHVFHPPGGSAKFARFHASLAAHGATRPLTDLPTRLPTWSYPPLFAADEIAAEIIARARRIAVTPRG